MCKHGDPSSIPRILKSKAGLQAHVFLVLRRSRQQIPVIHWSVSLAYLEHSRSVKDPEREKRGMCGGTESGGGRDG